MPTRKKPRTKMMDDGVAKWIKELAFAEDKHQSLACADKVFWELNWVVARNEALRNEPGFSDLFDLVVEGYHYKALVFVRAIVDTDDGSISLRNLYDAISKNPSWIDREWHERMFLSGRHFPTPEYHEYEQQRAHMHFSGLGAGTDPVIPASIFEGRRDALKKDFAGAEKFINQHFLHWDRKAKAKAHTYAEVRRYLVRIKEEIVWLNLLLRGGGDSKRVPTFAYNWYDVLRLPWLADPEAHPPNYLTLDDVK